MKLSRLKLYSLLLAGGTLYSLAYSCSSTKKQPAPVQTAPPVTKVEIPKYQVPANKPLRRTDDVWVWRSVLDLKNRIISIGLNDKLWVAYNTQNASLYKTWTGGIVFDGAVYTTAHGPQPTSVGNTYYTEGDGNSWIITANGSATTPEIVYKGHTVLDNKISLQYELIHQGKHIKVEERPDFFTLPDGQVGFERVFKTSEVPAGLEVALKMHLGSVIADSNISTDSRFVVAKSDTQDVSGKIYKVVDGNLILKNNGITNFSVNLTPKPFTNVVKAAPARVVNEKEERVLALMTKSDCNTCHNRDLKTVGPAFRTIAQRYPYTPKVTSMLIDKVVKGGTGNWGPVPMTPHPAVTKEDVVAMVNYILELDATQENREKATMPPSDDLFRFKKKKSCTGGKN